MKPDVIKNKMLEYIKEGTGLKLTLCDYFTEIKYLNGYPYFNILASGDGLETFNRELKMIENLSRSSGIIVDAQPNGVQRISIHFDMEQYVTFLTP